MPKNDTITIRISTLDAFWVALLLAGIAFGLQDVADAIEPCACVKAHHADD